MQGARRRPSPFILVGYVMAGVYSLAIVLPLYYLFVSSFKTMPEILTSPLAVPPSFDATNYASANRQVDLGRAMLMSTLITAGAEVITLALAFPAAYAIGRVRSRFGAVIETFFGLGFLVPVFAILVPVFLLAAATGLLNSPLILVLFYPAVRLPLSVLILASYVRQIPVELEESAFVDGGSKIQSMWHIVLPLTRPGIVTVLILNFIDIWNEYLFALILLSYQNKTAQVAVPLLKSEHASNFGLMAAGAIITMIPIYLVFILIQGRLTKGLLAGSLKG
jgi:multiple sugar transport system permease protein